MPQVAFEQNQAQVYAWAYRLLQNHHDALDVTQDVFIKWWRARGEGSVPDNPLGWLRRVTVNLAIDAIRSASRRASHLPPGAASAADGSDPAKRETARQIATALETLTERQRAVVVAKVYDDCTFAQIAEQMGLSVPTVKTHYLRGLELLRHKLPGATAGAGSSAGPRTETGEGHGP